MTHAETLSITATDGHRFDAGLFRADRDAAPMLVFLPALGTPARVYRGFAAAMAGQGIHVCTPDWRGMASSSVRASRRHDHGYRQLVEIEAPAQTGGQHLDHFSWTKHPQLLAPRIAAWLQTH